MSRRALWLVCILAGALVACGPSDDSDQATGGATKAPQKQSRISEYLEEEVTSDGLEPISNLNIDENGRIVVHPVRDLCSFSANGGRGYRFDGQHWTTFYDTAIVNADRQVMDGYGECTLGENGHWFSISGGDILREFDKEGNVVSAVDLDVILKNEAPGVTPARCYFIKEHKVAIDSLEDGAESRKILVIDMKTKKLVKEIGQGKRIVGSDRGWIYYIDSTEMALCGRDLSGNYQEISLNGFPIIEDSDPEKSNKIRFSFYNGAVYVLWVDSVYRYQGQRWELLSDKIVQGTSILDFEVRTADEFYVVVATGESGSRGKVYQYRRKQANLMDEKPVTTTKPDHFYGQRILKVDPSVGRHSFTINDKGWPVVYTTEDTESSRGKIKRLTWDGDRWNKEYLKKLNDFSKKYGSIKKVIPQGRDCWIVVSHRNPGVIYRLDKGGRVINQFDFSRTQGSSKGCRVLDFAKLYDNQVIVRWSKTGVYGDDILSRINFANGCMENSYSVDNVEIIAIEAGRLYLYAEKAEKIYVVDAVSDKTLYEISTEVIRKKAGNSTKKIGDTYLSAQPYRLCLKKGKVYLAYISGVFCWQPGEEQWKCLLEGKDDMQYVLNQSAIHSFVAMDDNRFYAFAQTSDNYESETFVEYYKK